MTAQGSVRPEMELLLASIQPGGAADRIRELASQPLDWEFVVKEAFWHNVAPLVYWRGRALDPLFPSDVLSRLRPKFEATVPRNLLFTGELVKLARAFKQRGIPVIAYKGPFLAAYYENIALREFFDLDLLVHEEDVPAAHELLEQSGYRPLVYQSRPGQSHSLPFARAFDCELTYENATTGVLVDLHWALMPGFFSLPEEVNSMWDRAVMRDLSGAMIQTLAPEDLVLIVCAHGTKHTWESLRPISDLARVLHATPDLNWDTLFERARQLRVLRALSLGLFLATDLLDAGLAENVQRRISSDRGVISLSAEVRRQFLEHRSLHSEAAAGSLFLMRSRDTWRDAMRCGLERVFRPTKAEWWSLDLPRPLFSLYYLIRPFRLVRKHGSAKPTDTPVPHS